MKKLLLVGFLCSNLHAATVTLEWDHDFQDVGGNAIDPKVLLFKVYGGSDSQSLKIFDTTRDLRAVYSNVKDGCYYVYVTAYREDQELESEPSATKYICVDGANVYAPTPPELR